MKNKLTIITVTGFLILFLLGFFIFLSTSKKSAPPIIFYPTPTPIGLINQPNGTSPQLQKASPSNNAIGIDTNSQISISLTAPIASTDSVDVWVYPSIPFSVKISGKNVIIVPTSQLTPGTIYTYAIKLPDGTISSSFTFTTAGVGPASDPHYDPSHDISTAWDLKFHPELFLANMLPYSTPTFYANSSFTTTAPARMYFTVTLFSPNGKNDFLSWAVSSGLTSQQLGLLDIRYNDASYQ